MLNKILILVLLSTVAYSQNQLRIIFGTGFTTSHGTGNYGNNTPEGAEVTLYNGEEVADETGNPSDPPVLRTLDYGRFWSGVSATTSTVRFYCQKNLGIARTIYYTGWVMFLSQVSPVKDCETFLISDNIALYYACKWLTNGKWALSRADTVKATSTNVLPLDQWLYFKMYSTCTSSNNTVSITLNGETLTSNLPFSVGATNYGIGYGFLGTNPTLPAGSYVKNLFDDIVVYDTLGSQYTVPDSTIRIYYNWPVADSSISGWTGGADGTTNLWDGIDNYFPRGTVLTETNISNIKDSVSSSSDKYYFKLASLNSLGYGLLNVRAIIPFVRSGEHNTVGTITGAFQLTTNPVNASTSFTFGNNLTAHVNDGGHGEATEFWVTTLGDIVYEPSMNKSAQTTMLIERTSLNSAVGCIDQAGFMLITGNALGGANFQYHITEW